MKNELKEALLPLYEEINFSDFSTTDLCIFNVQVGSEWEKENGLLFVGKAVNGWKSISEGIESLFDYDKEPLEWVEKNVNKENYNTNRSAFWRIIKKISQQVLNDEKTWYKKIAWSNLCKVSPNKGNPNTADFYKQEGLCKKILQKEIEILKPKAVILFTSDWDILGVNDNEFEEISKENWEDTFSVLYKKGNIFYIHSDHPQGKPEEAHKEAIYKLLTEINNDRN
ncbi:MULTISPECIES: uracil-DNA glycosylase family protein [Rodentibacter]|uniref:uracil-DNA glycosylase family protein n=1 Tax=Rodentibacter TaxID=1960084 RepID=UPI001CFE4307|nr:uracil-DNA glycosylase family protein [Rodentibacter sp. JRC1]GJI56777.1 hypothetical protein HEMROJRC1_18890 [Rodentibacter sp. JRC1]